MKGWVLNFTTKIDAAAPNLGLSSEMVATLKSEGNTLMSVIDAVISARTFFASQVAAKNTVTGSVLSFYTNEIGIIKKLPGYTDAIGESLGLIPPSNPFDPNNYQAKILSAVNTAAGGEVKLRFDKAKGNIEGVNMYMQRNGAGWMLLGFKRLTPYLDETPLTTAGVPEIRQYQCRALIGDVEIGFMSDAVQVTVS